MYTVFYKKLALKYLAKMPSDSAAKFLAAFRQLANADQQNLDIKKLEGREGFRLRIGKYRAVYEIVEDRLIIEVLSVGSRGDIYK
jgi:mRNA interferase RelE/StbE